MQENNPEINSEIPRPPVENPEAQEKAAEFLKYQEARDQRRNWSTQGEAEAAADKVGQIAKTAPESKTPDVHHEAGVPLKVQYSSDAEMRAKIDELIRGGKDVNPNDLQAQMENAWEQYNDKAA